VSCGAPLPPAGTSELRSSSSSSSSSLGIDNKDDRHGHESATLVIARSGVDRPGSHVTTEAASTTDAKTAAVAQ